MYTIAYGENVFPIMDSSLSGWHTLTFKEFDGNAGFNMFWKSKLSFWNNTFY